MKRELKHSSTTVIPKDFVPSNFYTIIIPVRNEEANIANCLSSIFKNRFSKDHYELIVVDDHSEDETVKVVQTFNQRNLRLLHLKNYKKSQNTVGFKKRAIEYAMSKAKGDIIVQTDGDCMVGKHWLKSISFLFETRKIDFLTGVISLYSNRNPIENFQQIEMTGLMSVTRFGIENELYYMANGANMAYRKSAVEALKNSSEDKDFASGDDMFLVQKMAAIDPAKIAFNNANEDAYVFTAPCHDLETFKLQRKRWATKTTAYQDKNLIFILGFIFVFCISIPINVVLTAFFGFSFLFVAAIQLGIKYLSDYFFLKETTNYFNRKESFKDFPNMFFMHTIYIIWSGLIGLWGSNYSWKGRKTK